MLFDDVYTKYYDTAVSYAYTILQDHHLAEDSVQNAYMALADTEWDPDRDPWHLIRVAVRHQSYNTARTHRWTCKPTLRSTENDLLTLENYADSSFCPVAYLLNKELHEIVENALLQIQSKRQRIAWILRFIEGYTTAEIARMLCTNNENVRGFISKCNKKLRKAVTEAYSE